MSKTASKKQTGGGKVLPALCNVLGVLLLAAVIGLCIPLTVPRLMGYQLFEVVSASMEPALPVGSAVLVKEVDPETLGQGDIVAYADAGGVVIHRVVTNRTSVGELVTKGDANEAEDFSPIPYDAVVGRMEASVPGVGTFMGIYATTAGKVYLLLTAACGVMFNILAARMRADRRRRAAIGSSATGASSAVADGSTENALEGAQSSGLAATSNDSSFDTPAPSPKRTVRQVVWTVVMIVAAVVFVGSMGAIGFIMWQYSESDASYNDASANYTQPQPQTDPAVPTVPKTVNFQELQAVNPDVVGWIYCEDTRIDYPVVKGTDNSRYLSTDYTGAYNINGSIFVDCENKGDFSDPNTIIYGHHMNSGSMFAGLEQWSDQAFADAHPIMWLLTPTQNYKVVLFSGRHVSSTSDVYRIIPAGDYEHLGGFLKQAIEDSDFKADVQLDLHDRYVMLSTCSYVFDDARYVLSGVLVPV